MCLNVPIWLIHHGSHDFTFIAVQRASQGQFGAVEITSITPSLSNKISSLGNDLIAIVQSFFGSPYSKRTGGERGWSGRETSVTRCKWLTSILPPRAGLKLNSILASHYCDSKSERGLEMNSWMCFSLWWVTSCVVYIWFWERATPILTRVYMYRYMLYGHIRRDFITWKIMEDFALSVKIGRHWESYVNISIELWFAGLTMWCSCQNIP